jgi:hypothetical protein
MANRAKIMKIFEISVFKGVIEQVLRELLNQAMVDLNPRIENWNELLVVTKDSAIERGNSLEIAKHTRLFKNLKLFGGSLS